ncbi:6-phosphogluconolactonase [Saliniradius amylolyticus]|uniref:6-phosphogluconolactonase n=1 Tax=Saliniradius amylolyticus TaxID=2183582 RepID=A0A2S2E4G6_9ALTE|nr:6-phosphogluconolactonase [Saliniradius amylolyticus]AWL12140.1 6-phosphogluconolactonase [Saliniradius amylolyticus]
MKQSIYESAEQLNQQFASRIAGLLEQGIAETGRASLVVSGGRTPQGMFKQLSEMDIDWSKVVITLADERWVPLSDDASNEKMVREHLLVNKASQASFVGLKNSAEQATDGVAQCNQAFDSIPTPFDVLILGMGEDGHTASLFPCSEQLSQGLDLSNQSHYIAVQPTTAPNWRMSLTLRALLDSKNTFVHLVGDSKRQVFEQALAGDDETEMPIRAVLKQSDVELVWAP